MYLVPFPHIPKFYTGNSEEDTIAQDEFKRWIDKTKENKRIANQIHQETLKNFGKTH